MMLDYTFDLKKEAALIEKAVEKSLIAGIVTNDLSTEKFYKTNEVGDWITNYILSN